LGNENTRAGDNDVPTCTDAPVFAGISAQNSLGQTATRKRLPQPLQRPTSVVMKILFLGDVMGRTGRAAVTERLPALRAEWGLDFVVVNGENASNGIGLTADHAKAILAAGADVITLGDHAFDQKDMIAFIETEPRIIRPLNFSKVAPGRGARVYEATQGRRVLVTQVLGQVFMKRPFDDPFSAIEAVLKTHPLGGAVQATIVDIHAEATSEKMGMGHWCDGQASLVVGTHTHVPTADTMILPKGTAYQSDAGMCGDYDSVIGMEKLEPLRRFVTGMAKGRFEPAEGPATLSGVYVETDDKTGRATRVRMIRIGGRLDEARP
jgi:2',3'-cyclic-nucleotide 2'-phosphodiesterase